MAVAFGTTLGKEVSRFLAHPRVMVYDQTLFALSLLGEMVWLPIGAIFWLYPRTRGHALPPFDLNLLRVHMVLILVFLVFLGFAITNPSPVL